MAISHPGPGDTVPSPFQTDGTVDPTDAKVSARVVSKTKPTTSYPGKPASVMGPNWLFQFDVPSDDYQLIVEGGKIPDQIDITVI